MPGPEPDSNERASEGPAEASTGGTGPVPLAEPAAPGDGESASEPPGELRLEMEPDAFGIEAAARAREMLVEHTLLERELPAGDLWMVGFDIVDKTPGPTPRFTAAVDDALTGRGVTVTGILDDRESLTLRHRGGQHPPRDGEHAFAANVVKEDAELGPAIAGGALQTYRPLPPLAGVQHADGAVERIVTVGLRATADDAEPRHRIVGVVTRSGDLVREPAQVPAPSSVDYGAPPAPETAATSAGPGRVRVRLWQGEELLWDLVVVRPSASSGGNGSGVELQQVTYKGQSVLARAHVPIVTAAYDDPAGGCGPTHRDWLSEESAFEAEGTEPVEGFRLCSSPPRTILETGLDGGRFRGVALWLADGQLTIVSQIQAGWHRFVSEWRLHADGTIAPRFAFSAAANPCTGLPHRHHAYWRFDFDIAAAEHNLVQEFNDPPLFGVGNWQTVRFEVQRPRDPARGRVWRVRNNRSGLGYWVTPGAGDGMADAYGAGDVWLLAYHGDEIDDGQGVTTDPVLSRAQLDRFLSAEPMHDSDVVVWYAAHAVHDGSVAEEEAASSDVRLGPDLKPFNWRPARPREPYPELLP